MDQSYCPIVWPKSRSKTLGVSPHVKPKTKMIGLGLIVLVSGCQMLEQQSTLYLRHCAIIIPTLTPHPMYTRYESIQGDTYGFTLACKLSLLLMPRSLHKRLRQTRQHTCCEHLYSPAAPMAGSPCRQQLEHRVSHACVLRLLLTPMFPCK